MIARNSLLFAAFALTISLPGQLNAQEPVPVSEAITFPFAPPIDETLRYRITRTMGHGETLANHVFVRHYRFARRPGGYRLWVELESIDTDAAPGPAAMVRAAAEPFVGLRYAVDLDANGNPTGIANQVEVWQATLHGIDRIDQVFRADADLDENARALALSLLGQYRAMTAAEQRSLLLQVVGDLLAFAGRRHERGSERHDASFELPTGEPVDLGGTIAVVETENGIAEARIALNGGYPADAPAIRINEQSVMQISTLSGLTHRMQRERRLGYVDGDESHVQIERITMQWLYTPVADAAAIGE